MQAASYGGRSDECCLNWCSKKSTSAMIATHVDDVLWACENQSTSMTVSRNDSRWEARNRLIGVEIQQFDNFSIKVTCDQTSLKLGLINVSFERHKQVGSHVTQAERDQLTSVCGSLMWLARSCRPGISYNTSRLQSATRKATLEDILLPNRTVKHVKETPTDATRYKCAMITWPFEDDPFVRKCIAGVSDAPYGVKRRAFREIRSMQR